MLRIIFFVILLATQTFGDEVSKNDLFQKGLSAYQNKQFTEARDDFQKVLDQGQFNPGLLHDLALSALQLDQKPYALALWRKALSIQPSFQAARVGRDLLESKMQMRPFERDSFNLWAHRGLERVSLRFLAFLLALMLGAFGYFAIQYISARQVALEVESPLPAFPTAAAVCGAFLIATLSLTAIKMRDSFTDRATVIGTKVSARSLPSDDGVPLFDLSGGSEVLIRRSASGWRQIQNADGSSGWVKDAEIFVTSGS